MPRYKADVYINDIYVTTYFRDSNDEFDAFDDFMEKVREDLYLDVEQIDG